MKVEINLFASLARYMRDKTGGQASRVLDVGEGSTIIDILTCMEVPLEKVKILFLNGIHATGDEVLKEGDRVGVFPPVAGG